MIRHMVDGSERKKQERNSFLKNQKISSVPLIFFFFIKTKTKRRKKILKVCLLDDPLILQLQMYKNLILFDLPRTQVRSKN